MAKEEDKLPASEIPQAGKDWPAHAPQENFTKPLEDSDIFLIKCPGCGGVHFRHAGYLEATIPYADPQKGDSVSVDSLPVKLCVKCKCSIVVYNSKIIDVTKHIDLNAWGETEVEAHKATGPGGQC